MSIHQPNLDAHIARVLHELLAGREPAQEDLAPLAGDVRACLDSMLEALRLNGVVATRRAFVALKVDRPWMGKLASTDPNALVQPERRIRFLNDSMFENRPPREWLIPTILPKEGIALLFGPAGCGKSFLTIAWSMCIATGTPWLGRNVFQGPVAYVASEGSFGIGPRLRAWKMFHNWHGESGVKWFDELLALQDAGNFKEMQTAFTEDFARPPVLVVIDTLSRCSGGADENSNSDMAKIISAADVLQQRFACTVLIVHHAGKDGDRGPRGASALTGNTETIIEVARTDEGCRVVCYKQKDAPRFEPFSLKFQAVAYGESSQDNSAVLLHDASESQPDLRASESVMLTALTRAGGPLTYKEWKEAGIEAGLKERTACRGIENLVKSGRVQKNGKLYAVPTVDLEAASS